VRANNDNLPELPKGWGWTEVGEIGNLIRGVSYKKTDTSKTPKNGYMPILRANNIDGHLTFEDLVYVPEKKIKQEQIVKALDIIIAMSSGSKDLVGKAAQALTDFSGSFGTFCGLVRPNILIDGKFVGFFFQSPDYRRLVSLQSSGVSINNLRRQHIESMPFPLPPLAEQKRIVAKIEELFTRLDAGVQALQKVKAELKRYRQAVLKYAFEGKLTAEWREKNKDKLEPASEWLWRVKKELKANTNGKPRAIPNIKVNELKDIPNQWEKSYIGEISNVVRGGSPRPAGDPRYFGGEIPWITVKEITKDNSIYLTSVSNYVTELGKQRSRYIEPGTFLLTNSGATLGVPKITNIGGCINDGSVALLGLGDVFKVYLYYFLTKLTKDLRQLNQGAAQPNLNTGIVSAIRVPICSEKEQEKVVEEIERHFSIADEIEQTIKKSLKQSDRLRQSILKKAFEGNLVPQDPEDEPAEKLLERIKAEKEKVLKKKRNRVAK